MSWYQKGKTNLDFTEARDSEWQWHQLGRMQVCTSLQTDNHANTPPLRSSTVQSRSLVIIYQNMSDRLRGAQSRAVERRSRPPVQQLCVLMVETEREREREGESAVNYQPTQLMPVPVRGDFDDVSYSAVVPRVETIR